VNSKDNQLPSVYSEVLFSRKSALEAFVTSTANLSKISQKRRASKIAVEGRLETKFQAAPWSRDEGLPFTLGPPSSGANPAPGALLPRPAAPFCPPNPLLSAAGPFSSAFAPTYDLFKNVLADSSFLSPGVPLTDSLWSDCLIVIMFGEKI
jgi:hypothetical protein